MVRGAANVGRGLSALAAAVRPDCRPLEGGDADTLAPGAANPGAPTDEGGGSRGLLPRVGATNPGGADTTDAAAGGAAGGAAAAVGGCLSMFSRLPLLLLLLLLRLRPDSGLVPAADTARA